MRLLLVNFAQQWATKLLRYYIAGSVLIVVLAAVMAPLALVLVPVMPELKSAFRDVGDLFSRVDMR